jgi:hypothetical protein
MDHVSVKPPQTKQQCKTQYIRKGALNHVLVLNHELMHADLHANAIKKRMFKLTRSSVYPRVLPFFLRIGHGETYQ